MAIDLSTLTAKQAISAIYIGYYDRAADVQGMEFWSNIYKEFQDGSSDGDPGMSLQAIATDFSKQIESRSPDFAGYSFFDAPSTASAEAFLTKVYLNLFDRVPDGGGLAFWVDVLTSGSVEVGEIILSIIEGAQSPDAEKILNKIEVADDWTASAADAGISTPANPMSSFDNGQLTILDQEAYDSARSILDNVDETAQSVADAKAVTDDFVDGYFNDAPVAVNSVASTNEDNSVIITPDVTDPDPGDVLTYEVLAQPQNGAVAVNANGTFTFTPNANYNGPDSFTYRVTDAEGETSTATVSLTVTAVDDAPVASDGTAAATEGGAVVTGSVSATDIDSSPIAYAVVGTPPAGLTLNANGNFSFDPTVAAYQALNEGEISTLNVTFSATADGQSDTGTLTITVTGTNDAPVASAATATGSEDAAGITVTAIVSDVDAGDSATFSVSANPANGSVVNNNDGTFTYTPDADFNGTDNFQYTVTDGSGASSTATAVVTVTAVNDAPVAAAASATLNEDASINGSVTATDVDNAVGDLTFSVEAAGQPANGTVTMNPNGTYTYTPNADYNGADSFTYTVTDPSGATGTATVSLTVTAVDDAPVTPDVTGSVDEDGTLAGTIAANDVDNDNASITYAVNTAVAGLVLNADGTWTFDAGNAAYQGLAQGETQVVSTTYTATSNGLTDTGTITITVTGQNDAPVGADENVTTLEDEMLSGQLTAADIDGDTLTFALITDVANGTLVLSSNGAYTYTPDPDYNGPDSFTYNVSDGNGGVITHTVSITVDPVTDVLTPGIDNVLGGVGDDVVIGSEGTLTAGDNIDGGDGVDTLRILTTREANFNGFTTSNVEVIEVTAEDNEGNGNDVTVIDASGIDGAEKFVSINSSGDLDINFANGVDIPGSPGNKAFNLELNNLTNNGNANSDTNFDARNSDTTGADDVMNIMITNSTTDGRDVGDTTIDSAIENIFIDVTDSTGEIRIDDLNTAGADRLTITSLINVQIGDTTQVSNIGVYDNSGPFTDLITSPTVPVGSGVGLVQGTTVQSNSSLQGFDNALSASVNFIDATQAAGGVQLSVRNAASGVDFNGGAGRDWVQGSGNSDTMNGGEGDDVLDGNGGSDNLFGEGGNDFLIGGTGNDTLDGGADDDIILGGDGADVLIGGTGDDTIDTGDSGDNSIESVDAGAGKDSVWTRGEQLDGRGAASNPRGTADVLDGGTDVAGTPDAFRNDELNVVGTSANVDGLDDVTGFEFINLIDGTFIYTISDASNFELYNDGSENSLTVVNGTNAGSTVDVDASTLDVGIALVGGDSDDVLMGGEGDDILVGDGDNSQDASGDDSLVGNGGDDLFIFDSTELNANDTVSGGTNSGGTDVTGQPFGDVIVIESRDGAAVLGAGISGIEKLLIADSANEVTAATGGAKDFNDNQTITLATGFSNAGIHIDGSLMDSDDELTVDHSNTTTDVDIRVTGGADDDLIKMGRFLDSGDIIEGGAHNEGDRLEIDMGDQGGGVAGFVDADFTNVTGIEILLIVGTALGAPQNKIVLGPEAFEAGITTVDLTGVTGPVELDTSAFPGPITIIDNDESNTIIGPNAHPATIELAGGSDDITLGSADDVIQIEDGDLDATDSITDNGGTDRVVLMNQTGPAAGIDAVVNLDNVIGIEQYVLEGTGDRDPFNPDPDDHSITFQGGNVGSVTDILIDGTGGEPDDSLTVVIDGDTVSGDQGGIDVDADYRFTFLGTDGDDLLTKNNRGVNNDIDFQGGMGNDTLEIWGGDLGASTTFDGGTDAGGGDIDAIAQLGGTFTDDDFIMVSNTEELTVGGTNTVLHATLGFEADQAGLERFIGGSGNDTVVFDAAFGSTQSRIFIDTSAGGDDTFDAGSLGAGTTVVVNAGDGTMTAADTIIGGAATDDELIVDLLTGGADATTRQLVDLSGVTGIEILTLHSTDLGAEFFEVDLGVTGPQTINMVGSPVLQLTSDGVLIGDMDGDNVLIDGTDLDGPLTFNGSSQQVNIPIFDSVDTVLGSVFGDTLNGGSLNDLLEGNGGNDLLNGGTGNDTLNGGTGDDTINGDDGNDVIDGGAGSDTIDGGIGNDTITGGADGTTGDVLTGGAGADDFRYVNVSDSDGLIHDTITDFVTGVDQIVIEENVLVQAGGGATSIAPVDGTNAPNFAQAQGAIGVTAGDGIAQWVFQAGNAVEAATFWIDVDDNGILNGLDIQIELPGVTSMQAVDVLLIDTIPPAAPTIASVTNDTGALADDFITNDDTLIVQITLPVGAGDGTDAKVGDTLSIFHPSIGAGSTGVTLTAVDIANGFYDFDITSIALPDGDYDFSAQIIDELNGSQPGAISTVQTITVDTTATISIDKVANDGVDDGFINAAEDDAVVANGTTTDVEEGATVTVTFDDGINPVVTALATVDALGEWAITTADNVDVSGLTDGNITVTAEVTDLAGNLATSNTVLEKDTQVTANLLILEGAVINAAEETDLDYSVTTSDTEGGAISITASGVSGGVATSGVLASAPAGDGIFLLDDDISGLNFDEGSIVTLTATVTDQAGNVATASDTAVLDTVGPQVTIDSATYNFATGALVFNGTFDPSDIDLGPLASTASSGTLINWDDGDGSDVSIEQSIVARDDLVAGSSSVSATQLSLQVTTPGGASVFGDWGQTELLNDASLAQASEDFLDLSAGAFFDVNGNPNVAIDDIPIGLIISTADLGTTTSLFGGSIDDVLTASNDGDTLTGNGGDDTFVLGANVLQGTPAGTPSDGSQPPFFAATITDLDVDTESDLIQFSGADLDAAIFAENGAVTNYAGGDPLNFQTYVSGTAGAATNVEGTIIFDAVNNQLRIDMNGDTTWTGAEIDNNGQPNDTGDDDIIIDLAGITGTLNASDFSIV